jgi:crotonobetainyl-CoA:carnitine CoA-transferase CaiB-like acyl-CoA transferase
MTQILEGIKVLDLTRLLPGPLCTQILGDLGAEVIKLEGVKGGDYARGMPPRGKSDGGYFMGVNRNKKSMNMDLNKEKAKEVFLKMIAGSDVVIEQFRPGVMERLGLGYRVLSSLNPRIIMCSITGYGQDGPYKDRAGHDINYLNLTGISHLTGCYQGKPVLSGIQIADVGGSSLWAALSIMGAIIAREKTGMGQYIDVSMTDCVFTFMSMLVSAYNFDHRLFGAGEWMLNGGFAWYNFYRTKDDRWLGIGMLEEKFWATFCRAIGREKYIGQQFASRQVQQQIMDDLSAILSSKTAEEWIKELQPLDICISLVNNLEEAINDPHLQARGMIVEIEHPLDGKIKNVGFPVKFSATPYSIKLPPPARGEHSEQILLELGYSSHELEEMKREGVF